MAETKKTTKKPVTKKVVKLEGKILEKPKKSPVFSIGRRKTAIAKVKMAPGTGKITINEKDIANPNRVYTEPLKKANFDKTVDLWVKVYGGGISSQLEAIRLGISRAIIKMEPELKKNS